MKNCLFAKLVWACLPLVMTACDYAAIESTNLTAQGMRYYQSGSSAQAVRAFQSAIMKNPNNDQALYRLAQIELSRKDYQEAKQHFESCISLRPDVAQYWYMLGRAQYEEALELFDDGFQGKRKDTLFDACSQSFGRAIALDPAYAEAHLRQARCYLANGMLQEAVMAFEASIHQNPTLRTSGPNGTAVAFKELGILYATYGFYDKAIAVFSSGILQNPGDVELETEFANVYQDMGRFVESSAHFEAAYEANAARGGKLELVLPAIFGAGVAHYALAKKAFKEGQHRVSNDEYAKAVSWFKKFNHWAAGAELKAQREAATAYIQELDKLLKEIDQTDEEA